ASEDFGLFARVHWARTTAGDRTDAQWLEATIGVALRPARSDVFSLLLKATHLLDQRPLDLTSRVADEQTSDVASAAAVVELPLRLAIAEKIALKEIRGHQGDGAELSATQ